MVLEKNTLLISQCRIPIYFQNAAQHNSPDSAVGGPMLNGIRFIPFSRNCFSNHCSGHEIDKFVKKYLSSVVIVVWVFEKKS